MDIGPLEYVVIGFEDDHFTTEILPALRRFRHTPGRPSGGGSAGTDLADWHLLHRLWCDVATPSHSNGED